MQKLFCNKIVVILYLLAVVLYTGQGFFFEGTWFTSLAGYFILLVNAYFTCSYFIKRPRSKVLKWMMLFTIWAIIVWFLSPKQIQSSYKGVLSTLSMVQYTLIIMTTTFSAIAFKKAGVLKDIFMVCFYFGIISLLTMNFFFESTTGLFDSRITNNLGYPIVALMPLTMFFWNKKPVFWTLVAFIFIMALISVKRGTILCSVVSILIIGHTYLKAQGRIKVKTILVLSVIGCILAYIGLQFFNNSDYLQYRLQDTLDGNTSSRDYIYASIINKWSEGGFFNQLFGQGPIATTKFGNFAHNDWLEVLYDFGLIGLLFYVLFVFAIYFIYVRKRNTSAQCKCAFTLIFAYYVLRSTFSMCFYVLDTVLVMFAFGYFIAECDYQKNNTLNYVS